MKFARWASIFLIATVSATFAQTQDGALKVDAQGQISIPAMDVPPSGLASPEMGLSIRNRILGPRDGQNVMAKWVEADKAKYPVTIVPSRIAGVPVVIYTPKDGIAPRNKGLVLINLHGGGFVSCFKECSALESIPAAAISGLKVITIDYRQGPDNRFPAASEDVASVYRELLKSQKPETIGLYGCSAGGSLVAESLAWFQAHGLPRPAAAGIFCAGGKTELQGDSMIVGTLIGNGQMPEMPGKPIIYFAGTDTKDPLASPVRSDAVLAKFPPTLVISGTRDFLLSEALFLHQKLTKVGNASDLHVWEGARHCFFYDTSVPESVDAFQLIARFFHQKLRH